MVIGQVHQIIRQAYRKAFSQEPPHFVVEPAKRAMFGDFSTNIALIAGKDLDQNPVALAQNIVTQLEQSQVFKNISVATPGFINFTVTDEYLLEVVTVIIKSPESYGRSDFGKETRVLVEYISP